MPQNRAASRLPPMAYMRRPSVVFSIRMKHKTMNTSMITAITGTTPNSISLLRERNRSMPAPSTPLT